jgi:hypothetical protein
MELEHDTQLTKDTELCLLGAILSEADIERLGRHRPDAFRTSFAEIGFCFSLLTSMFMAVSALSNVLILADALPRNTSPVALD